MTASPLNAKKITKKDVTGAYDLVLAAVQAEPDTITSDETPEKFAATMLAQVLSKAGYALAANLGAIIRSHESVLKRGEGAARMTPETATDVARDIYRAIVGRDLPAPVAQAAVTPAADATAAADASATADTQSADTQTAEAQVGPATGESLMTETVTTRPEATEFEVKAESARLIDPTLAAVTAGTIGSIDTLLGELTRIEAYAAAGDTLKAAYAEAIAAFKDGATEVDESGLVDLDPYKATGFSAVATDGPMVGVLDNLIAQGVSPQITFAELIGRIRDAEEAAGRTVSELKALKRDLRMARPKERIRIDAGPTTAGAAADLSEADELIADLEVEMVPATDIFTGAYGASSPILGFEVPKFSFAGDHPDVPEVDPNFRFYAPVLAEALHGLVENEIIWLHGESGCGKSEFWAQLAARLGMPFTRMNFDGHLTRSDILGVNRLLPDPETGNPTMRFIEGALPRAMARPGILLLDELDLGDPEIMPILQPVLEGNPLRLLEDGGRLVKPHPMFRIAVTGNTIGLGSENQMYLNAFEQSAATRDRISAFVQMPYLPADIEKDVVMARVPMADEQFVERVIQLANKVREGYRMKEIDQIFSTRSVQYCARRYARFAPLYNDPHEAALAVLETVVLGRMNDAAHNTVKGFIDNIFA